MIHNTTYILQSHLVTHMVLPLPGFLFSWGPKLKWLHAVNCHSGVRCVLPHATPAAYPFIRY